MSRRILVTGGAGFIGGHLVEQLLARGDDVVVLDDLSTGKRAHVPGGVELVEGDVADEAVVERAFARGIPDAVLHVAGQASIATSFTAPERDLRTNVQGTLAVLGACARHGVPRLLHASSMTAYGEPAAVPVHESAPCIPVSNYGVTKLASERYALIAGARRDVDLAVTALRMFNVYGERQDLRNPYQGVLAIFIGNVLRGEPITIHSDGEQTRDFVHVHDVVDAWLRVLDEPGTHGRALNVGSGIETSIKALAHAVVAACTGSPEAAWDIRTGPAQLGDQRRSAADIGAIRELTGWAPQVPLGEGVQRTVAWARGAA